MTLEKEKTHFYQLRPDEWKEWLSGHGHSQNQLRELLAFGYKRKKSELYSRLIEDLNLLDNSWPIIKQKFHSIDGTKKILFQLHDGNLVEAVILEYHRKPTVCLSTQVGCAMACTFCRTGQQGMARNLRAHEMVGMYLALRQIIWDEINSLSPLPNIVFMGQGEPLHNFDELKRALQIITHPWAINVGPRQITISTVGYLPGLRRLNELPPINLAFSLHSPFKEERQQLIPMEERFPLEEIFQILKKVTLLPRQYVTLEYLMIQDLNHSPNHAKALSEWASQLKAVVNLIPYNDIGVNQMHSPSDEQIERFKVELRKYDVRVMQRVSKGADIKAACGQLSARATATYSKSLLGGPELTPPLPDSRACLSASISL